jgi:ribose/xylose/arabinose/galactoside ABC-type transport system permease subunit
MLGYVQAASNALGSGIEVDMVLIALLGGTPLINLKLSMGIINMFGAFLAALALTCLNSVFMFSGLNVNTFTLIKAAMILVGGVLSFGYYSLITRIKAPARKIVQ